ncbi:hypothetical protein LMG28727_07676 [Paraburkholderia kirstenboschensis]|nr:hypothetical protein LMG28727_07676 [Paraburkholderia kirstenboschensis]
MCPKLCIVTVVEHVQDTKRHFAVQLQHLQRVLLRNAGEMVNSCVRIRHPARVIRVPVDSKTQQWDHYRDGQNKCENAASRGDIARWKRRFWRVALLVEQVRHLR